MKFVRASIAAALVTLISSAALAQVNPGTNITARQGAPAASIPWLFDLKSVSGTAFALGQTTMSASLPVAISSNQSALGVTGTFWQATQPVSGTFWQATQPVSAASLPLPTGAATETTSASILSALATVPVTGTFWQATQPVSIATMPTTPVTGTFWQATQPVSNAGTFATQATLAAETTKVIGTVNQGTSPWIVDGTGGTFPVTGTFWQATQPVSAASLPLPSGASTAANQASVIGPIAPGTAATNSLMMGGQYVAAGVTLTDGQQAAFQFDNSGQLKTVGTFSGSISAGATASATDPSYSAGPQALSQDLSGYLRSLVKGTVTANAGTNLNTSLLALEAGGNLASVANNTSTSATNTGTIAGAVTSSIMQSNVAKINNVTPLMGNGVTGTGSMRVTIASDNTANSNPWLMTGSGTAGSAASGVVSVQGIASMTPLLVTPAAGSTVVPVAATTGGLTMYHLVAGASTNAVAIKASAGQLYNVQAYNNGATNAYLKFYDMATTPTCNSDTVVKTVLIPSSVTSNGSGANFGNSVGTVFASGLSICVTGAIADNDNTAVSASQITINIDYK